MITAKTPDAISVNQSSIDGVAAAPVTAPASDASSSTSQHAMRPPAPTKGNKDRMRGLLGSYDSDDDDSDALSKGPQKGADIGIASSSGTVEAAPAPPAAGAGAGAGGDHDLDGEPMNEGPAQDGVSFFTAGVNKSSGGVDDEDVDGVPFDLDGAPL